MPTQTTAYTAATVNGAPRTYLNKDYHERELLRAVRTNFVYAKYGQKRSIPEHNGKTVKFRVWNAFDPALAIGGLTEGVTPEAQDLSQSQVEATVAQYGRYVEVSDMLRWSSFDDVMAGASGELGEQLGRTIEWVTRNALLAGTNVLFAGGATSRSSLTVAGHKLTTTEIRKAVRELKKAHAPMFSDKAHGKHYIAIVSPDATYDLQSDSLWQDVSKYSSPEHIYSGEIGRMFGVVFVESTETATLKQSVLNAVSANTSASTDFVLKDTPTAREIAYLSVGGNKIKIAGTEYTLAASGSYAEATKTVKLSTAVSLTADAIVASEDAGALDATTYAGADVNQTVIFGSEAYGVIDLAGKGAVELIVKQPGSAGTSDPLNQRATIAAKVGAYTAKILNNNWLIRVEHCVSA